jgi:hypothetical protein
MIYGLPKLDTTNKGVLVNQKAIISLGESIQKISAALGILADRVSKIESRLGGSQKNGDDSSPLLN